MNEIQGEALARQAGLELRECPASSKTLSACGNSLKCRRKLQSTPAPDGRRDLSEKVQGHAFEMDISGKSDGRSAPEKPLKKGESSAKMVEERRPTKDDGSPTAGAQT